MSDQAGTSTVRDEFGNEIEFNSISNSGVSSIRSYVSSKQFQWGDIPTDSDVDDDGADDDEQSGSGESVSDSDVHDFDADIKLGADEPIHLASVQSAERCLCRQPTGLNSSVRLMEQLCEMVPNSENYFCYCNNIIKCYNFIYMNDVDPYSPFKVAFSDMFFRLRHELLFKMMCRALNLPATKSDTPFSQWGIDSKRTPDLIIEQEKTIVIIEVTATSSTEKAAVSKGMEQMGFESKYQKEIDALLDLGLNVAYCPLFFNMSDLNSPMNREQFEVLKKIFPENKVYVNSLIMLAKQLSIITNEMKHQIALASMMLFTETEYITPNHPDHSFLYTSDLSVEQKRVRYNYNELTISSSIYNKVLNNWDRLEYLIDNSKTDADSKVSIVINTSSHRLTIERNTYGISKGEFIKMVIDLDKVSVFKNVFLKTGDSIYSCINSESGVKFLETTESNTHRDTLNRANNEIRSIVDHATTDYKSESFNMDEYVIKCENYKNQAIVCNIFDQSYEDKIIQSICEMDVKHNLGADSTAAKCIEFVEGGKLLGQMSSKDINIDDVMLDIESDYIIRNSENDSLPRTILKMKSPFIMPLACINGSNYCKIEFKNAPFIKSVIGFLDENPFTKTVLERVLSDDYKMYTEPKLSSSKLQELYNMRSKTSNNINSLFKSAKKENPNIKNLKSLSDTEYYSKYKKMSDEFNKLQKEIKNRQNIEGVGKDISYIRLPTKGARSKVKNKAKKVKKGKPGKAQSTTNLSEVQIKRAEFTNKAQKDFEIEMQHFRNTNEQSTIEGFGMSQGIQNDLEFDQNVFNNICVDLMTYCGENPDKFIHDYVADDSKLLFDLKKASLEEYTANIHDLQDSMLGHAASFVSRLGHSLMFYSQQAFSGDYIRVDNLGYKNILLFVKGGQKIFKTKQSKMFRLLYPVNDSISAWYKVGQHKKSSCTIFKMDNVEYILTPWSFWHENILTDSISFYHRICSFVLLNLSPKEKIQYQFHKLQLNTLLAFHNRRQTEVLLANMRYILLSTLGDFTGVDEILKEFFGFNYDRFQAFIRNCIFLRYPEYFKSVQKLKTSSQKSDITETSLVNSTVSNIFTNNVITNSEDLVLMIYSTFLMTKAPYQKLVERSTNLKGILKIHELYDETVGLELNPQQQFDKINIELKDDYVDYTKNLFRNDFNFDAKYCALLGNFMNSYFENEGMTDQLHFEWVKIINTNWDEMATSTGLRGKYKNVEDFWGKKGYFVVYKELLLIDEFRDTFYSLLNSTLSDSEKRKSLRNANMVYKTECSDNETEFLIFHAVDKSQWRGNREVYVMSVDTKILQQPIERYVGFLCTKVDNELISVPSDRRAQVIHHSIFEKDLPLKDVMTWYLTLDCSKWAPKSITSKFIVFFNNMRCIPNSFKIHFMNYIEKLFKKRLYFNVGEVEILLNNPKYNSICKKYLIKDDVVNGYYINAPYSWVMGIFNYVSSLLHAANQKYFSYLLTKTTLMSYKEEVTMVMYAHSDDSGGRICAHSKDQLQRALILYEVNLHAANHLLSKKKSVVSKIYFEILSIIYMFKKLLSLLPKFLGGLRFLPTDKGPAQDIMQSYSKCIEVVIAGADFSISYLVMKIASHMIYKFYFNKDPTEIDYKRPTQYIGMPDAHPIMTLLCGSDADIIRLIRTDQGFVDLTHYLSFMNCLSITGVGEGPIKPVKFLIKIKNLSKDFDPYIEHLGDKLDTWSIRNVNYHSTLMNTASFLKKLKDPGFVGSLVNESLVRRVSRAYFMRYGNVVITRFGNLKLKSFNDSLKLFSRFLNKDDAIKEIFGAILTEVEINKILDEVKYSLVDSEQQIEILKRVMASPLKLLKYFDRLSLENRKITTVQRTLKPTLLQLVKGSNVFSVDFDPASLVSYIKEPEMRWALQNVKNLNTATLELKKYMSAIKKDVDTVEPDMLLKVCRAFGRDNVRNVYLYSRVPGNIRQVKTYSAFLSFLSVNSFANKEIAGLTIKLRESDMGKEYVMSQISDDIYIVNNIISLLITLIKKCSIDFVTSLTFNQLADINFPGGSYLQLIEHLDQIIVENPEGVTCRLQYNILKHVGDKMGYVEPNEGAFYTFLKEQKSKIGWYGKGEVYIYINNGYYNFEIENNKVKSLITNKMGKIDQVHERYILDVFENINISIPKKKPDLKRLNELAFGYDNAGNISILHGREILNGVPCKIRPKLGGVVDNLNLFKFDTVIKDYVIMKNETIEKIYRKKLYMLPLKKVELMPLIQQLLNYNEFVDKSAEMGLNGFEDFLMTELMPEYGSELVVDFDQFIDNYSSSKTYSMMKYCYDNSVSKLPNKIELSTLPANETSFVRLMIDYTNHTGEKIVISPNYIDSEIMKLRSEYPDQMPAVFVENLVKNYKNIYSGSERAEIEMSYQKVVSSDDIDESRSEIIKLMTHWGYSSLVNVINEFTFTKTSKNYAYFNYYNCMENKSTQMHLTFEKLVLAINLVIESFSQELKPELFVYPTLSSLYTPVDNAREYVILLCLSAYGLRRFSILNTLVEACYYNLICALLMIDEAVVMLNDLITKIPLINSLLVDHKNRFNFLILINNLKICWQTHNKNDFNLNFIPKLQRLPDNIPALTTMTKKFGVQINPAGLYHHTMLNNDLLNFMTASKEIWVSDELVYRLTFKIKPLSNISTPLLAEVPYPRPFKEELFDTDDWDEFLSEITMSDLDLDTIEELWVPVSEYLMKKQTKVQKLKNYKVVMAPVTWVIALNASCKGNFSDFTRQCGENLFILSDCFNGNVLQLPHSGYRIVNFSKTLGVKTKPFIVYYSVQKELDNNLLLDKLFNNAVFPGLMDIVQNLKLNKIRDSDGDVKPTSRIGRIFEGQELMYSGAKYKIVDDILVVDKGDDDESMTGVEIDSTTTVNDEADPDVILFKERLQYNKSITNKINEVSRDLNLESSTKDNLLSKFSKNEYVGFSMAVIFKSIMTNALLNKVNDDVKMGNLDLTREQHVKMMHNPTHFGLAYTGSKTDKDPIKDKKLKCEIKSIHQNLPSLLTSSTLVLSEKYKKVLLSHYKMWVNMVKHSDFKTENKKFLLQLFLTIVNNARKTNEETHDVMWHEIIDKCTVYFAQTLPDSDEDDIFTGVFMSIPGARIQYRAEGQ